LYKRSFIMYDRGTKSLWVHVSGEAVRGERKGQKLKFLPSVIMQWGEWKLRNPLTTVLEGRAARGMMGHYGLKRDLKNYGLSVGEGKNVRLYRFSDLAKTPVINDSMPLGPIVVVYDKKTGVARAFMRGERTFNLKDGKLVDDKGAVADPFTGRGAELTLESVPATVWLRNRWRAHFPKGEIYKP